MERVKKSPCLDFYQVINLLLHNRGFDNSNNTANIIKTYNCHIIIRKILLIVIQILGIFMFHILFVKKFLINLWKFA